MRNVLNRILDNVYPSIALWHNVIMLFNKQIELKFISTTVLCYLEAMIVSYHLARPTTCRCLAIAQKNCKMKFASANYES